MNTQQFRTKTEFIKRDNGIIPGVWEVALDIGYSSVKVFSPNIVATFPSYATRVADNFQFITTPPSAAILYRDNNTNDLWLVGEVAQNMMSVSDTSDSEATLYSRERYNSVMFNVIVNTGLGISMMDNEFHQYVGEKIVIQTGLPERYLSDQTDDEDMLKESLSGTHNFSLKIGSGDWVDFSFNNLYEDVYVMSQPKGSLFSTCITKSGSFHSDAQKYLTSNILVLDPGFGTLDIFQIKSGSVINGETYPDLGMRRVLQETCSMIKNDYNVVIPVPAMQQYLETGFVKYMNRKTFESKEYPFGKLLFAANEKVCEEAIQRMSSSINLLDYNYMIITGGTGAAWLDIIKNKFKDLSTLKILHSNQNDNLSFIYSNARGYYFYRFNKLGSQMK